MIGIQRSNHDPRLPRLATTHLRHLVDAVVTQEGRVSPQIPHDCPDPIERRIEARYPPAEDVQSGFLGKIVLSAVIIRAVNLC